MNRRFEACWAGLVEKIGTISSPPGAAASAAKSPPRSVLDSGQLEILRLLAHVNDPEGYPQVSDLAELMREGETKVRYYLDRLKEQGFIHDRLIVGEPAQYYLTATGRAYVVENDLL